MRDFDSPEQKRLDDARAKVEQAIAENQPQHVINLAKQVYWAALQAA